MHVSVRRCGIICARGKKTKKGRSWRQPAAEVSTYHEQYVVMISQCYRNGEKSSLMFQLFVLVAF